MRGSDFHPFIEPLKECLELSLLVGQGKGTHNLRMKAAEQKYGKKEL